MRAQSSDPFGQKERLFRGISFDHLEGEHRQIVRVSALDSHLFYRLWSMNREWCCNGPDSALAERSCCGKWAVAQGVYGEIHGLAIEATDGQGGPITVSCIVVSDALPDNPAHCGLRAFEPTGARIDGNGTWCKRVKNKLREEIVKRLVAGPPFKIEGVVRQDEP